MKKCKNCNKETNNPQYCSRSCAAIKTNKEFPKRTKTKKCKTCKNLILKNRTYCKECFTEEIKIENKTIKELKKNGNANKYGYPMIRQDSRRKYIKSNKEMKCQVCGYYLHVDICHVKDIKNFEENTLIKEVNDLNNLVALCKNHHWEFDNRTFGTLEVPSYIPLTIEA